MRSRSWSKRRPIGPALAALGAALVGSLQPATAADDRELFARADEQRVVVFASVDWGRSVFAAAGSKQTLVGPIDRTGYVALESTGFGITRERFRTEALNLPAVRLTTEASTLIGHQWTIDRLYVAAYAGPELRQEQVAVGGTLYRLSQPRLGIRGQLELFGRPTDNTIATATVVAGSTKSSLYVRAATGIGVARNLYVGPEAILYMTDTYREVKVGAHLTGASIGIVQTRISAGWMSADDRRHGSPYVGLTAYFRL